MNKKRIWLILPAAIMPYVAIFAVLFIRSAGKSPIAKYIMETFFFGVAPLFVFFIFFCLFIAWALVCVCFIVSICKKWDALSLAKTTMIIKLVQIPAYILIFLFSLFCMLMPFTMGFALCLFIWDCVTLIMTGLLNTAAVILAVRQRVVTLKESIWVIILQCVFCADVVASIIFYKKLKRKYSEFIQEVNEEQEIENIVAPNEI